MTFVAAVGSSLLRSLVLMVIGTAAAIRLVHWLRTLSAGQARMAWLGLLIPCVTPSLVTGYCYRDTAMSLIHFPWGKELLYAVIVAAQTIPVAALMLWFAPAPAVSESALYCQRLYQPRGVRRWMLWLRAHARNRLAAAAAIYLLAFQEADLAALMQTRSWTEWLFTRHAAGLTWQASVQLAVLPLLLQLPALIPVGLWIAGSARSTREGNSLRVQRVPASGLLVDWLAWGGILLGLVVVCLLPARQLWRGARQGWPALFHQRSTWEELGDAGLLAVTSGGLALLIGSLLILRKGPHREDETAPAGRRSLRLGLRLACGGALLLPGLLGNLTCGLLWLSFFQTPGLGWAYETPFPLILGETLAVLPRTAVMLCCLSQLTTDSADHQLELLRASDSLPQKQSAAEIAWRTQGLGWLAVALLTGFWIYLEAMLPVLLAMPGMAPVGLVLYNALHYGRISALGAKLVLAIALPICLTGLLLLVRPILFRPR
ncbi:hypothetical protein [Planctomicrobium sp. SH664]|uniref:hypothetical protein n=1 Tax=Planctomicrobium sp. SH664 TaxID=3448125 RepID=UPI003F5B98E6